MALGAYLYRLSGSVRQYTDPVSDCLHWCARDQREESATVAQKIQTLFIDDLDGSSAEGTVRFGLDGVEYEID